jgi:hypothetical protein
MVTLRYPWFSVVRNALLPAIALLINGCSDERTDGTTGANPHAGSDVDTGDSADSGTCDRFCVWDRFMDQGYRTVYASCICNRTIPADEPIQPGKVELCENSVTQTGLIEVEQDCIAAMTVEQIAEIEDSVECYEEYIQELLPCLNELQAGDVCGTCEPLDEPEGSPPRCPISYETNLMAYRCTDGRPGF